MGKSPEELKRIRSEAGKKAAATRRANAQAAVSRKQETKQKTKSSKWDWLLPLLLVLAIVGIYIWKPWVSKAAPATPAPVSTEALVVQSCPNTTEEAKALFGVDVQRIKTEPCAWVWRGKPSSHIATCPSGYVCTWDIVNDITVVHLGINQTANIYAGTWRLINAYPVGDAVYDTCALYAKEKDFGQREIPSFEVRFQSVPGVGPQSCPEQ